MKNIKVGDEKQQTTQQATQQTNNKQITTNKNVKNIYIYLINKYRQNYTQNFYGKMRFLREIKQDEKYKKLTEQQIDEFKNVLMAGNY